MSQISVPAVLSGAMFDFLALVIFGFIVAFVFVMTGAGTADDVEALYASSPGIDLIMAILNYAALVVIVPTGGYLAAKIARKGPLVNGALSSSLCVLTYAYSLMGWYPQNLASSAIAIASAPLLGLLGGYLYRRRMRNFLQVQA
jgi:hypothetical protein